MEVYLHTFITPKLEGETGEETAAGFKVLVALLYYFPHYS
jgi:hypothetical protein